MKGMGRKASLGGLVATWAVLLPAAAWAQQGVEDRAAAFRAASGRPPVDQVPGGLLMVLAYAFIWLLCFLFVWRMARRLAALERTAEQLEQHLAEPGPGAAAADGD